MRLLFFFSTHSQSEDTCEKCQENQNYFEVKTRAFPGHKKRALVDPVQILSDYFDILKNKKIIKNILEIKIFSKK